MYPLKGNDTLGYFGTVSAERFISGCKLANLLSIEQGHFLDTHGDWLKFKVNGHFQFITKKPIKYGLSWDYLDDKNLINGGEPTIVTVNDKPYQVTLLEGESLDLKKTSEWNQLMYKVHNGIKINQLRDYSISTHFGCWDQFSNEELGLGDRYGGATICKNFGSLVNDRGYVCASQILTRGGLGVSSFNRVDRSSDEIRLGWRPVLKAL